MYIKVIGQGADLVMLPGWSMHSGIWNDLANALAQRFTVHLVDLPGHGHSAWQADSLELPLLTKQLADLLPYSAHWLGWSLGGLISLAFADRFPKRVNRLILLAATPRFVVDDDWHYAVEPSVFNSFSSHLHTDQTSTLQRFLLLLARGGQDNRATMRRLQQQLASAKPPVMEALQAGLQLLIETDLRAALATLNCPVKMILGARDHLIPQQMLTAAQQLNPKLHTALLAGASHAPFISQATQCQYQIECFLDDSTTPQ